MIRHSIVYLFIVGVLSLTALSCRSIPTGATVVQNFNAEKYMGNWYEIARMDFKYEKNMNNTIAQYSLKDDGDIKVVNSGYNYVKNEWKSREANAKFREQTNLGALKVSFFGPFYSGYNILALDENYKYALVAGKNLKYLWILSREKTIPEDIKQSFIQKAQLLGYKTNELVWVDHNMSNPYLN